MEDKMCSGAFIFPVTINEFDVNNKLPSRGRDGERFVRGSDGSVYYTEDHYKTFKKIE